MAWANLYPGVYYGLGQFVALQVKLYTHDINHDINSVERFTQELFNFQQVTADSVLSEEVKWESYANRTEILKL